MPTFGLPFHEGFSAEPNCLRAVGEKKLRPESTAWRSHVKERTKSHFLGFCWFWNLLPAADTQPMEIWFYLWGLPRDDSEAFVWSIERLYLPGVPPRNREIVSAICVTRPGFIRVFFERRMMLCVNEQFMGVVSENWRTVLLRTLEREHDIYNLELDHQVSPGSSIFRYEILLKSCTVQIIQ